MFQVALGSGFGNCSQWGSQGVYHCMYMEGEFILELILFILTYTLSGDNRAAQKS